MTTTDTTTHDWLDRMNESYAEVCSDIENGGDWVAYDLPRPVLNGRLRIVIDGEWEHVKVLAMTGWSIEWETVLSLSTPFAVLVAIIDEACEVGGGRL